MAAPGVHRLAIPTPFAVGRVNCYLIEDDPLTLVDTGPNSGTALTALEAGLAALGRRVEDLERIVLTHQHIDHIGLAGILATRSGAEICALDRLAPWLASYGQGIEADDAYAQTIMLRHGLPADLVHALRAVTQAFRGWGSACTVTHPVSDGGELAFAGRTWSVHHRPGHSPSDTVFFDAGHGELLAGDHLIAHISSNPLISRPLEGGPADDASRPPALIIYMESLRATRAMEGVSVLQPGHGEPITDHVALIDERFRLHERRARKIHGLLRERPRTAYELGQDMWGNIAVTQAYLVLSEVLGHVDLLIADGRAVEQEADGILRYADAG